MTKPSALDQQMLTYLMAMSREEQERIPPTRAGLIAWLGTDAGVAWLIASPLREIPILKCSSCGQKYRHFSRKDADAANVE